VRKRLRKRKKESRINLLLPQVSKISQLLRLMRASQVSQLIRLKSNLRPLFQWRLISCRPLKMLQRSMRIKKSTKKSIRKKIRLKKVLKKSLSSRRPL
jgi:hypothetical protein